MLERVLCYTDLDQMNEETSVRKSTMLVLINIEDDTDLNQMNEETKFWVFLLYLRVECQDKSITKFVRANLSKIYSS